MEFLGGQSVLLNNFYTLVGSAGRRYTDGVVFENADPRIQSDSMVHCIRPEQYSLIIQNLSFQCIFQPLSKILAKQNSDIYRMVVNIVLT